LVRLRACEDDVSISFCGFFASRACFFLASDFFLCFAESLLVAMTFLTCSNLAVFCFPKFLYPSFTTLVCLLTFFPEFFATLACCRMHRDRWASLPLPDFSPDRFLSFLIHRLSPSRTFFLMVNRFFFPHSGCCSLFVLVSPLPLDLRIDLLSREAIF